jgi:hypothetical protein
MKSLNEEVLMTLHGGTQVCDIIAGASLGWFIIGGGAVGGGVLAIGGLGCWAGWW